MTQATELAGTDRAAALDAIEGPTVMWVNGRVVAPTELVLRPDDHCLVGDGAFEAIKVIDGVPFALTRHLQRLVVSATPLGIAFDLAQAQQAAADLMRTPQVRTSPCWLRITVTGGSAPLGTGGVGTKPTLVAAVAPMAPWGPASTVVIAPWTRNERSATAGLKTISYAENVIAYRHAKRLGADECVFANTVGQLCEGTGSNVFLRFGDRLVTPTLSSGCLAGVTRDLLLEWMPDIVEEDVPIDALRQADEAFLTSTSRDVHPIGWIDGSPLPQVPGPLTSEAMAVWAKRAAETSNP